MQLTKIIATITNAYDAELLIKINNAGVNVLRINFTHATPENSLELVQTVQKLNDEAKIHMSLLLDTKGPDIRTGDRATPLVIKKNQIFTIYTDLSKVDPEQDLFCDYPNIINDVSIGQEVVIDSGALLVSVVEKQKDALLVKAKNDATIWSKRHINLPGVKISLPALIEKDKQDILFGIQHGFSYIAASFIRTGENVKEVRKFLDENGGKHIKIISKIENKEAIDNLDDIVHYSDGVMVARGDLGIELPITSLPGYQKQILDMGFKYGKPVIIATELLKSMVESPFPTRAEISDIHNSVIMRSDAVMLSDETAIGKYPLKAITYMQKTIVEAEKMTNNKHKDFFLETSCEKELLKKAIARQALMLADEIHAKMIVVFSLSWHLAQYLSAFKPNCKVFSFTKDKAIHYGLGFYYGIHSELVEHWGEHTSDAQEVAVEVLKEKKQIKKWDYIIVVGERVFEGVSQPQIRVVPIA